MEAKKIINIMTKEEVSKIGLHCFCMAQDLCNEKGQRNQTLSEHRSLYRWWFPEDSHVMAYIQKYFEKKELKYIVIDGKKYYALYLGKTTNVKNRFRQHTEGPVEKSTLRETIRVILSLKSLPCSEDEISKVLQPCYFEWMDFVNDKELLDSFEMIAIALGFYPLNIEGNHSVSRAWKKEIMKKRHELKNKK